MHEFPLSLSLLHVLLLVLFIPLLYLSYGPSDFTSRINCYCRRMPSDKILYDIHSLTHSLTHSFIRSSLASVPHLSHQSLSISYQVGLKNSTNPTTPDSTTQLNSMRTRTGRTTTRVYLIHSLCSFSWCYVCYLQEKCIKTQNWLNVMYIKWIIALVT